MRTRKLCARWNASVLSYIELLFVAWERTYMANAAAIFSDEHFDSWNDWVTSLAECDPNFVWPMVRDSRDWHPPFVQHVNQSLGYPKD